MTLFRQLVGRVLRLPKVLTRQDRLWLSVLGIVLLVGIGGMLAPQPGGKLREAIVAESSTELERQIETLTHAGLVRFNEKLEIQPALAQSFEIKEDGKLYEFKLIDGVSSNQLVEIIKQQKNGLSQVEVQAPDERTLQLRLKQPFAPLLADLTKPMFPFGYYKISKRSGDQIRLEAGNGPLGQPAISTIIIEIFHSKEALAQAINQKRIDAAVNSLTSTPSSYQTYTMKLPRRKIVFLNLTRQPFIEKKKRQDLATQAGLEGRTFELTTVDTPQLREQAQKFIDQANARGATASLRVVNQKLLEDEIIPKHNFDALLLTVDFGRDPDPYSFWHSSQIEKGQNLSVFVNKKADRIMEDARLTIDEAKRKQLYGQLDAIVKEEVPAIFLEQEVIQYHVSKKIKGIVIDQGVTPADRFGNVKDWYVKTKKVRK